MGVFYSLLVELLADCFGFLVRRLFDLLRAPVVASLGFERDGLFLPFAVFVLLRVLGFPFVVGRAVFAHIVVFD